MSGLSVLQVGHSSTAPIVGEANGFGSSDIRTVAWANLSGLYRLWTAAPGSAALVVVVVAGLAGGTPAAAQVSGNERAMPAVCERTPEVRDAIVDAISGVSDCADVQASHLAGIDSIRLGGAPSLTGLAAEDFAGLTGLHELRIERAPIGDLPAGIFGELAALDRLDLVQLGLRALPAGVFDELTALQRLSLAGNNLDNLPSGVFDNLTRLTFLNLNLNSLTSLRSDVFDGLTELTDLSLARNKLSTLPAGVFDSLGALSSLALWDTELTSLPAGVFDRLTAMTDLTMHDNDLGSLPAGAFDRTTALSSLSLYGNSLNSLPDGIFEHLSSLALLSLHNNPGSTGFTPTASAGGNRSVLTDASVILDGSGSGGPWGANVTYSWEVAGTPTVTLDDSGAATPGFTAPDEVGELVFTLTVTGAGNDFFGRSYTDSDTATVKVSFLALDAPGGTEGWLWVRWKARSGAPARPYSVEWKPTNQAFYGHRIRRVDSAGRELLLYNLESGTEYDVRLCEREAGTNGRSSDRGACSPYSQITMPARNAATNDIKFDIEFPEGGTTKQLVAGENHLKYRFRVTGINDSSLKKYRSSNVGVGRAQVHLRFRDETGYAITFHTSIYGEKAPLNQAHRAIGIRLGDLTYESAGNGYVDHSFDVSALRGVAGKGPLILHQVNETDDFEAFNAYNLSETKEQRRRLCVEFADAQSDVAQPCSATQTVAEAPSVDGTPRLSGAGADAQWGEDESAGITVTFSEPVNVDTTNGTPSIGIGLSGTDARTATYVSGTGTTDLVFQYTLVSGDGSHGMMGLTPDSLALNGGTIQSAGSGLDAVLTHQGALVSGSSGRDADAAATFTGVPKSHDGENTFTLGIRFRARPTGLTWATDAPAVFETTGGSITGVRLADKGQRPKWEVTVTPDGGGDVTIRLPARDCAQAHAVCLNGQPLSEAIETTVEGPAITAQFTQAPPGHDGSSKFLLQFEFNDEPKGYSYRSVRDALFTVQGGHIEKSRRLIPRRSVGWEITVVPDGDEAVTLTSIATTDCTASHAACDAHGRKFDGGLSLTIPGPATPRTALPVVSVSAPSPVTEGTAAAFTLARTGSVDAAVTVAVSVSESESMLDGTPATSVTFATGASSAVLNVATEDDATIEDASTITVTVSSGTGYAVDEGSRSAEGIVSDNDAAVILPTVSIAAAATPIMEGTNAAFTLTRTGGTNTALAVAVSVSESASVLDGTPPTSVSIPAGSASTTLRVATEDDDIEEEASTVTAALGAGSGYQISSSAATAEVIVESEDLDPITAQWTQVPEEHDGSTEFALQFEFSHDPAGLNFRTVHHRLFSVSNGAIVKASRLVRGSSIGWEIKIAPDGNADVWLSATATTDCDAQDAICDADGRKFDGALQTTVLGPAPLSVADATVTEEEGATLDFVVTLGRSRNAQTTVVYATSDGTARAGDDYTAASGTLTFEPNETSKTVEVTVHDDAHDEGTETMTLTLSNASGAYIEDATATGTIENNDPMPKAWMVRFGRTVGSHVVEGLTQRLEGGGGSHVTVASIGLLGAPGAEPEVEESDPFGLPDWAKKGTLEEESQTITADDLLLRSAFHLSSGDAGAGPAFTAWGNVTTGGFETEEDGVTMDGDVTTGLIGFDAEWDRALAGVMLSQSTGEGSYLLNPDKGRDSGTVESELTGVYPYARLELNQRVSAWALAGLGSGELTLHQTGKRAMPTDITLRMGAVGVKGQVLDGSGPTGVGLNVKSDAMWVGMKSADTDELDPTQGDITRLRLTLQGERMFESTGGATFTPSAEVGVRHDGGDAETGVGLEVGAGMRYTAGALTIEGRARTLLAHESSGYEEWGLSGAVRVNPSATGRGFTLSVAPEWGRTGSASEQLWSAHDARELSPEGEFEAGQRLVAEAGYGFGLTRNRGVLTPYAGMTFGEESQRSVRTGARWQLGEALAVGLEAQAHSGAEETTRDVTLRAALRF